MKQPPPAANLPGLRPTRGIGIARTDFGTGYASLTYLEHHLIDVLKIDRGFLAEVPPRQQPVPGIIARAARRTCLQIDLRPQRDDPLAGQTEVRGWTGRIAVQNRVQRFQCLASPLRRPSGGTSCR